MLRRVELATGLTTSVLGILGWAYAAFGPTYRYAGSVVTSGGASSVSGSRSVLQHGLGIAGIAFFIVVLMIVVGFAVCTYWHSQRGTRAGLALLWMLTVALWLSVVLGAASIGMLLLPGALLAAVTSVVGSLARTHPRPARMARQP